LLEKGDAAYAEGRKERKTPLRVDGKKTTFRL
jgi:hypothetical protein